MWLDKQHTIQIYSCFSTQLTDLWPVSPSRCTEWNLKSSQLLETDIKKQAFLILFCKFQDYLVTRLCETDLQIALYWKRGKDWMKPKDLTLVSPHCFGIVSIMLLKWYGYLFCDQRNLQTVYMTIIFPGKPLHSSFLGHVSRIDHGKRKEEHGGEGKTQRRAGALAALPVQRQTSGQNKTLDMKELAETQTEKGYRCTMRSDM